MADFFHRGHTLLLMHDVDCHGRPQAPQARKGRPQDIQGIREPPAYQSSVQSGRKERPLLSDRTRKGPLLNMRLLPGSHRAVCLLKVGKGWADFVPDIRKNSFCHKQEWPGCSNGLSVSP